jgi:hypothetical protein
VRQGGAAATEQRDGVTSPGVGGRLAALATARSWRTLPLIWLAYLLATLVATYPFGLRIGTIIAGKNVDGWQNVWTLWWQKKALFDLQTNPFHTDYLYHPTGVSLLFHTHSLGVAPFNLPLQFLLAPAAAHTVTLLLVTATAGFTAHLLLRDLGASHLAAFAGGIVFALNPYQIQQLSVGQTNLSTICWLPLYALLLLRALRGDRWKPAVGAGLMLVLISLTDWQYAFQAFIFTGGAVLWEMGRRVRRRRAAPTSAPRSAPTGRRARKRKLASLKPILIGGVVGLAYALPIAPLVLAMIRDLQPTGYAVRPYRQVVLHSVDLVTYLLPNPEHPLWGGASAALYDRFYDGLVTNTATLGYGALLLALTALVFQPRRAGFWLAMFALFAALALGPELLVAGQSRGADQPLPLPYRLYAVLPFVNVSRTPSLFLKIGFLCLAVAAAFGLDALRDRLRAPRWRIPARALSLLLIAIIGFEYFSGPLAAPAIDPPPAFYQRLLAEAPGNGWGILDVPSGDQDYVMFAATLHGWPIVGGNLARDNPHPLYRNSPPVAVLSGAPNPLSDKADIISTTRLEDVGEAGLAASRIRWVIVHETRLSPEQRAVVDANLRRIFPGRAPDYVGDRLIVYEVRPPSGVKVVQFGAGWYDPERLPQNGQPYRWIGQRADLHVYSSEAVNVTIRFQAHSFAKPFDLSVAVNGTGATNATVLNLGSHEFTATLQPGNNLVTFSVATPPNSAASLGLGQDTRRVSVGISQLQVTIAQP